MDVKKMLVGIHNFRLIVRIFATLAVIPFVVISCSGKDAAVDEAVEVSEEDGSNEAEAISNEFADSNSDTASENEEPESTATADLEAIAALNENAESDSVVPETNSEADTDSNFENIADVEEAGNIEPEVVDNSDSADLGVTYEAVASPESESTSDSQFLAAVTAETAPETPDAAPAVTTTAPVMNQSGASVLYVKKSKATVYGSASTSGAIIRTLEKGDHILVTVEGSWARTAAGEFIQMSALSSKGVGRERRQASWSN